MGPIISSAKLNIDFTLEILAAFPRGRTEDINGIGLATAAGKRGYNAPGENPADKTGQSM